MGSENPRNRAGCPLLDNRDPARSTGLPGSILAAGLLALAVLGCASDDGAPGRGEASPPIPLDPVPRLAYVETCGLPVPTWREEDGSLRQSLDGVWLFREDPAERGDEEGWALPGHDRSGWREIGVPGVWNAAFPDLLRYEGVGWYALEFDVTPERSPERLVSQMLRFGAVFLESRVYLNGVFLGEHSGGYTPFHVDTIGALRQTGNVLVVRADNRIGWETIPVDTRMHRGKHGWWPYGGISRPVTLHELPDPWIFKLEPAFGSGEGGVDVTLGLRAGSAREALPVSYALRGPEGEVRSGEVRLRIPQAGVHGYRFEIDAGPPEVWSRASPGNLYRLSVSVPGGDRLSVRFGYRTLEIDGDRILLNGERDFWWGISRHSDCPDIGSVETPETIAREVEVLEALHANHVRPGHYPVDPRLLDALCDAGITILEEVPVYQLDFDQLTDTGLIGKARHQLAEMIERDKNNPAILAWSLGNEFMNFLPGADTLTAELADQAKALDPARPTAAVIAMTSCVIPLDFALGNVDIIGVNEYYGWYFGLISGAGPCLDSIHEMYPDKPIAATEFGAGAVAGNHLEGPPFPERLTDHSYTEEWQAWFLGMHLEQFLNRPYLSGVMPWVLADFRMEWDPSTGDPHPVSGMNLKGLLTHDRSVTKLSFHEVAEIYRAGQRRGN